MTETFAALVSQTALDVLAAGPSDVETICTVFVDRHPDAFAVHGAALAMAGLKKRVKDALRQLEDDEDDSQLALPGLHLPTAIAYEREDGGPGYVRTDQATWEQLVAGRVFRERNVIAAQAKLRQYDATLDRLRPYMETTSLTVADALLVETAA